MKRSIDICEFFYWLRRSKRNHNFTTEQRKSNTEKKINNKNQLHLIYVWNEVFYMVVMTAVADHLSICRRRHCCCS